MKSYRYFKKVKDTQNYVKKEKIKDESDYVTFNLKPVSIPPAFFTFFQHKRQKVIILTAVFVAIGFSIFEYIYYLEHTPAAIYQRNLQTLTSNVKKTIPLPSGEQPVTATVTDASALPHEPFFAHALNGDKILMYKAHKEAILFRPSTNAVIAVSVLDFTDATPTPALMAPAVAAMATSSAGPAFVTTQPQSGSQYSPQGKILVVPNSQ